MQGENILWFIVIGTGLILAFVLFFLVVVFANQRRFIAMQRDKIEASKREQDLLRQLPEKMMEGEERERKRLARELHDGINQMLASVNYRLHTAKAKSSGNAGLTEHIDGLLVDLGKTMEEVRRMSHNLHPKVLDQRGFNAAVQSLCSEFAEQTGISIRQSLAELPLSLPKEIQLSLFRIVQEALTNIQKHAQASLVSIETECTNSYMNITIADNGKGFDPSNVNREKAEQGPSGIGLTTIRERAALLRGTATIDSNDSSGTTIVVKIPLSTLTHQETPPSQST
ncbi:MAG: sensor histidine kinase [Ignavibacteriae bacterium]|nr:sensor histidine kinase [Ignavibacteria bacterium]MBI3364504.1 sensor histidine kinase [Ignavibacteriota bacterium]